MNFIKKFLISFFISTLLFFIVLIIFNPIFKATHLIFPYSISKFDIIATYPILWKNIKIAYCINCFITIYLLVNSLQNFILIKKYKPRQKINSDNQFQNSNFNLLIGFNNSNNQSVYITEKGLYQNILVTGTIGAR